MLLVLTVLATLAGVMAPAALSMFDGYGLRRSAEAVRSDCTRARLSAVQQGVPYEFRAEVGGTRWVIVPAEREATGPADAPPDDLSNWTPVRSGTLADGVTFPSGGALTTAANRPPAEYFEGLPDAASLSQAAWSAPVRFLPDGTAVPAAVVLADEGGVVRVVVRGLTGTASIEAGPGPSPGAQTGALTR